MSVLSDLLFSRIDQEKGNKFITLLLGYAHENAVNGVKSPLTLAYSQAKNAGKEQEPTAVGLALYVTLRDFTHTLSQRGATQRRVLCEKFRSEKCRRVFFSKILQSFIVDFFCDVGRD